MMVWKGDSYGSKPPGAKKKQRRADEQKTSLFSRRWDSG